MKYFSLGQELLTRESWKWFWINDKKKVDEKHHLFCVIRETEEPDGELKDLMESWQEIVLDYSDEYESIMLEKVSFHRGCGDYEYKWYIIGQRLETSEEMDLRLGEIKKLADQKQTEADLKEKKKQEKEYQEYLKLQAKFGKGDQHEPK